MSFSIKPSHKFVQTPSNVMANAQQRRLSLVYKNYATLPNRLPSQNPSQNPSQTTAKLGNGGFVIKQSSSAQQDYF